MNRMIVWTIILLANACGVEAVAQSYVFPVCSGNASSWHLIKRKPNSSAYTHPVMQTLSVDRDTVAFGQTFHRVVHPEEAQLDPQWLRSDAEGLFRLTAGGEVLWLPASVSLGDSVFIGAVTDSVTVHTPFGKTRAYHVTYKDSLRTMRWTIADGIGIWNFYEWRGKGSSAFLTLGRFISGRRCGRGPTGDPIPIDVPLRPGDILVHGPEQCQIQSARPYGDGAYWVGLPGPSILGRQSRSIEITYNEECMVVYDPLDYFGSSAPREYYPAFVPATDSVRINGVWWEVSARFDTTLFSDTVRAFSLFSERGRLTVADRFGVIFEEMDGLPPAFLESAVVAGVKYNRSRRRVRLFPICEDNVYEYELKKSGWTGTARAHLRQDTIIDGTLYRWFALPGIPRYGTGGSIHTDLARWFCETDSGVISPGSGIAYTATPDYGDLTPTGVIVRIAEIDLYGKRRVVCVSSDVGHHYGHTDTLAEDIGMISSISNTWELGTFQWHLLGARICGEAVGMTLGTDRAPELPQDFQIKLYPNPAAPRTGCVNVRITSSRGGDAVLRIVDMLGRVRKTERMQIIPGTNFSELDVVDLASGSYIAHLDLGDTVISTMLVVR